MDFISHIPFLTRPLSSKCVFVYKVLLYPVSLHVESLNVSGVNLCRKVGGGGDDIEILGKYPPPPQHCKKASLYVPFQHHFMCHFSLFLHKLFNYYFSVWQILGGGSYGPPPSPPPPRSYTRA